MLSRINFGSRKNYNEYIQLVFIINTRILFIYTLLLS